MMTTEIRLTHPAYRMFLFVASQIGREVVRGANCSRSGCDKPGVYANLRRLPPHLGSLRRDQPAYYVRLVNAEA